MGARSEPVRSRPRETLVRLRTYAAALGLVAAALLLRQALDPLLGDRDLAEELLRRIPSLRVLYSSGYTDDIILHRGILQEGTPFLAKPFSPAALARKVREVLDAPGAAS